MVKQYFELDKVQSITLHCKKETGYKWFKEIPSIEKSFMGVKYKTIPSIPAGWSGRQDGRHRVPTSYFNDYFWYTVDEISKKVYNKAYVEIRLKDKNITHYFNSSREAQEYVDELIESTDGKFHVIY